MTTAARTLIAKYWKGDQLPSKGEWLSKIAEYLELAKLTNIIRGTSKDMVKNQWKYFNDYLKKQEVNGRYWLCLE